MSSDAIYYCENFVQLNLPLTTEQFSSVQLSYRFWYRQNKLESSKTVNIPNVTTCFMVPILSNINENCMS